MYRIFKGFHKSIPGYVDTMLAGLQVAATATIRDCLQKVATFWNEI